MSILVVYLSLSLSLSPPAEEKIYIKYFAKERERDGKVDSDTFCATIREKEEIEKRHNKGRHAFCPSKMQIKEISLFPSLRIDLIKFLK